jgi:hypothetical protein
MSDAASSDVEHGQDKGGGAESEETERSGVGEPTVEYRESRLGVVDGVATGSDDWEWAVMRRLALLRYQGLRCEYSHLATLLLPWYIWPSL